jgi:hypothetical protein
MSQYCTRDAQSSLDRNAEHGQTAIQRSSSSHFLCPMNPEPDAAPLLTYCGAEEWARSQTLRPYLVIGELGPQTLIPS